MLFEKYGWTIEKLYLHRPIKILHFLISARIQKMFNIALKYFSFFNDKPPQAESHI